MPIYEYKCNKCNEIFEHFQKISDDPLKTCLCGSKGSVFKIISSSGFRLNGTGWNETDFKNVKKKSTSLDTNKGKSESKAK